MRYTDELTKLIKDLLAINPKATVSDLAHFMNDFKLSL